MEHLKREYEYDSEQKSYSTSKQLEDLIKEYRLTHNNFNPNKSSPPNKFMDKLEIRMKYYYSKNISLSK